MAAKRAPRDLAKAPMLQTVRVCSVIGLRGGGDASGAASVLDMTHVFWLSVEWSNG